MIRASHIGVADDSGVTGCDTSSSLCFWDCVVPENEGTAFLRTVGNHQVTGAAPHPKDLCLRLSPDSDLQTLRHIL